MHPMTSHADVTRLHERIRELARDNRALADANAQLRAELAATMLPYQGHTALLINGVLTIVQHSGIVYEMVEQGQRFTDDETDYGRREFRKLPPVPGSPAARIDAAMPLSEMGVLGDAVEVA